MSSRKLDGYVSAFEKELHEEAAAAEAGAKVTPFTIWPPSKFLEWQEPPGSHFLLPKYLTREQITSVIGPPGVGKSRALLWLSLCQITKRKWCGLETGGDPQRWLLLGDENSVGRLKHDLALMMPTLSKAESVSVEEHLRIQAVLGPEDGDLDMDYLDIRARIIKTFQSWPPGIIVFDPLASFYSGDLSKPSEMKSAVKLIERTVNSGARGAATLISHHARPGRMNTIQAVGFDSGNFASGGKSLLARSRCVINLAEADENGTGGIVIACAKANDCRKFEPRAATLDPKTMTYEVDNDFSLDTWKASVEGKAAAANSLCTLKEVVSAVRDGYSTNKKITEILVDSFGVGRAKVQRLLRQAVDGDYLRQIARGQYAVGGKHNLLFPNEK